VPIKISAVICTHNRVGYARRALASLVEPGISDDQEVLVVDNASTDATAKVVSEFASERVRYLYVPTLGLSHARNAGWQGARGEYVAYLDDDAVACPGWLGRIVEAFETVRPRPGCVGGKVLPRWESPRPPWLSDAVALSLTIVDWPDGPRVLRDVRQEWLAGTNIAVRRVLLQRFDGFTPRLDRVGKRLVSNGDIYLQLLIAAGGDTCWYDPSVAVVHHILASRLAKRWFYRRYYSQGVSDAVMETLLHTLSPRQRLGYVCRHARALRSPGRWRALLSPTDDPEQFAAKCSTLTIIGRIAGMLGAAGA
jgi:glucosyl-dolichyl phosphate glucuronosyltransferase